MTGAPQPAASTRRMEAIVAAVLVTCTMLVGADTALAAAAATVAVTTHATLAADGTFSDAANISVAPSGQPAPTGTVTFSVYGPFGALGPGSPSCVGTPLFTSTNPVSSAGTDAMSDAFTPRAGYPGIYVFTARYNGDAVYPPASDACGAAGESVTVPFVAIALPETVPPPLPQSLPQPIPSRGPASPPRISRLAFSPRAFSVALGATSLRTTTDKSKRHSAEGTTVSYALSAPGVVTITISRLLPGHAAAKGRGCVPASATNGRPKHSARRLGVRCTATRTVGMLVRFGRGGTNSFQFTGRLGVRPLAVGSYLAQATVNSATPNSASAAFEVRPAAARLGRNRLQ